MNTISNPLYFIGVVEDNKDPINGGRVRVRAFGVHPPANGSDPKGGSDATASGAPNFVPTEDLPWAQLVNGTMGSVFNIPEIGEWVFGMFIDGRDAQHPLVFGTLPGTNLSVPAGTGIPGEDGYLRPSREAINNFGNLAIPPYMSGEQGELTPAAVQLATQNQGVETADGSKWNEPNVYAPHGGAENTTVFQGKYAGNSIVVNDNGDGSTGYVLITHNSGTAVQIDEDGSVLIKTIGDRYDVSEGLTYNKSKGDTNTNIGGSYNLKVEAGSNNIWISGDMNIECNDFNVTTRGKMRFNAAQGIEVKGAKISMESHTDNIDIVSARKLKIGVSDVMTTVVQKDIYTESVEGQISTQSLNGIYMQSHESVISMKSLDTIYVESTDSGINIVSPQDVNVQSKDGGLHVKSGSVMRLDAGGQIDINTGSNVYIEGAEVRMAEGATGANAANASIDSPDSPDAPAIVEMPSPPAQTVSQTGTGGIVSVRPRAGGPTAGAEYDDVE